MRKSANNKGSTHMVRWYRNDRIPVLGNANEDCMISFSIMSVYVVLMAQSLMLHLFDNLGEMCIRDRH